MKIKKSSKKVLTIVFFVMFIIAVYILINNKIVMKKSDGTSNNVSQDANNAPNYDQINNDGANNVTDNKTIKDDSTNYNSIKQKSNNNEDKTTPKDINYMKISNENKICSSYILGKFENGKELSTEQYLKVAYNALNNGYILSNKTNYSEEEINNIVYSIFNVKLNEHKSIEGLTYTKGIYTLKKVESKKIELNNVQNDVAAGNTYVEFDINGMSYTAKLGTNTLTGETYIISLIED